MCPLLAHPLYLLFPFFSHICALFCAILHFLARIKYATLFFSSDSALFGKNTRGGVPESVWQLQVVATNCARPTTLSQYVVVATNKNRVPTQTRTPPLTEEQNEAIPGNLRSITRPFNPLTSSGCGYCAYLRLALGRMREYLRAIMPFEKVLFSSRENSRWGKPLGKSGMPSPISTGTIPM